MSAPQSLRHVASAVQHAEALADEAEDLGNAQLAERLRIRAAEVNRVLDRALQLADDVAPLRETRARAHLVLSSIYSDCTQRILGMLPADQASRLTPGGSLDVVERVRFRLRTIADGHGKLRDVRGLLERALFTYDATVDAYLVVCADAQSTKDQAIVESQALRLELERAKGTLLTAAEPQSDAWQRIKARAVRTKRARWLDDARARFLFADAITPLAPPP